MPSIFPSKAYVILLGKLRAEIGKKERREGGRKSEKGVRLEGRKE